METHPSTDTRHTFLCRAEVIARYRWGRTKGYLVMSSPGFPRPIAGDRYRLDTLMAWEDGQMIAQDLPPVPLAEASLPAPRRAGRRKAF